MNWKEKNYKKILYGAEMPHIKTNFIPIEESNVTPMKNGMSKHSTGGSNLNAGDDEVFITNSRINYTHHKT